MEWFIELDQFEYDHRTEWIGSHRKNNVDRIKVDWLKVESKNWEEVVL